jgi:imidazolonepropionase-like amidohydrolase
MKGLAVLALAMISTAAIASAERPVAIIHGRLLTVSHGTIADGVVVMRGGRIEAVGGPKTSVPKSAQVFDAKGGTVYPGLFDTEDKIGVGETKSPEADVPEGPPEDAPTPTRMIADTIRPIDDVDIERINGITNAVVTAGTAGPLPGHSAVVQLVDDPSSMVIKRDAGVVINLAGRRAAYPSTVFGIVGYVRQLLIRAQELKGGSPQGTNDANAAALMPCLDGGEAVIVHATNDTEVSDALDLAQQFKLKLILVGLTKVDTEIDRVAQSGFPVVMGSIIADPPIGHRYDYLLRLPARLAAKGVKVSISTVGWTFEGVRQLPYLAGAAVPYGFSYDQALRSITLNPAEAFGLDAQLGSLDVGKTGNVVIANGDPLDVQTTVTQVFIGGRPIPMTNRLTRLRDKYMPK